MNPTPFPDVTVAVVAGNPAASGVYAIFAKYRPDGRSVPHTHPDLRIVTVLSGTYYSGLGPLFDETKTKPLHAGSVLDCPWQHTTLCLGQGGDHRTRSGDRPDRHQRLAQGNRKPVAIR